MFLFVGRPTWEADLSTSDADARFVGSTAYEDMGEEHHLVVEDVDGDGCDDLVSGVDVYPDVSTRIGETFVLFGQYGP